MALPRSKIKIIILFTIAIISILILIFLYFITYKQINTSLDTSQKLTHSTDIQLEIERLISELQNAETSQRGFLLTSDSSYLTTFELSKKKIASSIDVLKSLLEGDQFQQYNLRLLHSKVDKRFDLLVKNMRKGYRRIPMSSDFRKKMEEGHKIMDTTLQISNRMIEHENAFLLNMRKKHYDSLVSTPIIYFSIVVISLTIFTFLLLKVNDDRKKLRNTVSELVITNHSFEQAEKLAGLGYWRHNFEDGQNSFSDNYFTILGIKRGDQGSNFRHLMNMVLQPDKAKVIDALKDAFRHYKPFAVNYRVQLRDGSIRHIKSIGKTVVDSNMQRYLIGINMDVSELVVNSNLLEMKNSRLELLNADLASFNFVASHDLQAPLRKIQLFISRLIDIESGNLSETAKEYLKKMNISASQMQVLINDLLLFSRTTAGNKKFELCNLNELLVNAIEELSFSVEESKADISSEILPFVSVIPYQIQQLFINFLSNSIKFSKPNVSPVIRIKYKTVDKSIFSPNGLQVIKKFHLISFIDNGIGFENEYAQKIFNLLFRLHDKSVYPGSGIGLAICKKIAENHFGFIEAESVSGEGAMFSIYLPVNIDSDNSYY